MKLVEYADRDMMMIDLANILAEALFDALHLSDWVTFAVPGGTTPGPIFDYLSATDLNWAHVNVLLSDERWLPETSVRSNTRLLRQRLMVERAAATSLIPLYTDTPEPEDNLDLLIANLKPYLPIDVLLLGMGDDMHTASLFPGADKLAAALAPDAPPLMAMRAPGAPEPRVTLTAPILAAAQDKHIVITGPEKRTAFEAAQKISNPMHAPVTAVWAGATVHWAE
ncbi:MAG: 6-phosphogluconolactonase [Paracoccaceae bacterium]